MNMLKTFQVCVQFVATMLEDSVIVRAMDEFDAEVMALDLFEAPCWVTDVFELRPLVLETED